MATRLNPNKLLQLARVFNSPDLLKQQPACCGNGCNSCILLIQESKDVLPASNDNRPEIITANDGPAYWGIQ